MAAFEIVHAADDPGRYADVFSTLSTEDRDGDPLYGAFGRDYYPAVLGDAWTDTSFAVIGSDGDVAVLECGTHEGRLTRFDMPIRVLTSGADASRSALVRPAVRHAIELAGSTGSTSVSIADPSSREHLSELGLVCLANEGRMMARLHAMVDLSRDVASIRSNVRSRFRSHVNWGERSLTLEYCNHDNPDPALFALYERLHADAAGRRTRADDSWHVMFQSIEKGTAELSVVTLDHEPVGAVLVVDGSSTSYYASAAFVRERFEHPLGHWPMMNAMLRARGRGQRLFHIGELPYRGEVGDKELSIGFFKRGFAERIEVRPVWLIECGGT